MNYHHQLCQLQYLIMSTLATVAPAEASVALTGPAHQDSPGRKLVATIEN